MKRRSLLQAGLLAPLVARAQTPCPAELTTIDGDPVPPGPECVSTGGWPTQRPGYLPVVPNLAGYGCDTLAGYGVNTRGDNVVVLYVTNLNDTGAGSLRAAWTANTGGAARVIVFNVEGYINLSSGVLFLPQPVSVSHVTVAGQTAPGKGVCLTGSSWWLQPAHTLVQHMHTRPGDASVPGEPVGSNVRNGFIIYNFNSPTTHHVVVDHCSATWGMDDQFLIYTDTADVTVSHCIFGHGLHDPGFTQPYTSHGTHVFRASRISMIGNLCIHTYQRCPLIGSPSFVWVNNYVYNWASFSSTNLGGYSGSMQVTAIGNNYKRGPNDVGAQPFHIPSEVLNTTQLYMQDNRLNGVLASPQSNIVAANGHSSSIIGSPSAYPAWSDGIVPATSADAADLIIAGCGPFSANRDGVDATLINDLKTGGRTGGFSPVNNPYAYPAYGKAVHDHRTEFNYKGVFDPIPDGQNGRPAPGRINGATGRTLIEEWCQRRAAEVEAV